ncbi:MAG: hypothetical protein GX446_02390 [Chthonomonadales bacterium]|nr:hypothetical protein [Chthonomonadales bacterium]
MVALIPPLLAAALALAAPERAGAIRPDATTMRLDEIGIYRVGFRLDNGRQTSLPMGWSGHFVEPSGISCTPYGTHDRRQAFLLHCPWRNGTGVAFQEFTFIVPRSSRIRISGLTAMGSDAVGKSDGATFRVAVNGKTVMERHQTGADWMPFETLLQAQPGKTLVVRFETDPGPRRDASFDFSLWADRVISFEGFMPAAASRPSPPALDLRKLVGARAASTVPPNAYGGRNSVTREGDTFRFAYHGRDGSIEYVWDPAVGDIGSFKFTARMAGDRGCTLWPANAAAVSWTGAAHRGATSLSFRGGTARSVRKYRVGSDETTMTTEVSIAGKALIVDVRSDRGAVASVDFGGWGPILRRRQIPMPYYGTIAYAANEGLFLNAYLDWTRSSATSHAGLVAHYGALTDGRRNAVSERAVFAPGWHLAEALPSIPNPASPYRKDVGSRIVLDVWGGRYAAIAEKLELLHSYGIRDCVVLIHDWQRSGYDNALPMHLPAAADKGGDSDMQRLVHTAVKLGHRIALHENYVDYYPNYDHFDESHIALDPSGQNVPAWYNPGTRIQSFAVKPNAILSLAQSQSPEIHSRFGTNACYLDVHSAVPPWFHVDHRATEVGAGAFARVREAHTELFAYERATHQGPVFGEGNAHWYWSGLLDGVEAQFGTGWPANEGMSAPLIPVFNLMKVHPVQINHGQGYYERWWKNIPWGAVPTMEALDQYRMQELVYGHAGFLGASAWDLVPAAWLEHHLMTPVTARHSVSSVAEISYFVSGKWADSTAAARAGDWSRPRIEYANGLTLIANNGTEPWRVHGATLPQFGWLARGAGVTAYTAIRDEVVCDYAETDQSVFANARPARHWSLGGRLRVAPRVSDFRQIGPRQFSATYAWVTRGAVPDDLVAFVHFSEATDREYDEGIRFQQDHALPTKTSEWTPGMTMADGPYEITVPEDVPDGTYTWTIGLFKPGGRRAILEGPTDRSGRTILGVLSISEGGDKIEFTPVSGGGEANGTAAMSRLNEDHRIVTFASVRTDGSVLVRREGSDWVLRTWPREARFTVELNADRFPVPERIRRDDKPGAEVTVIRTGRWWRLELNGSSAYRWRAP